jgi:hypothetical protein
MEEAGLAVDSRVIAKNEAKGKSRLIDFQQKPNRSRQKKKPIALPS